VLSVTSISREFLRVIRADPTGFVRRSCGCLRSSRSWIGSAGSHGGIRPGADPTGPLVKSHGTQPPYTVRAIVIAQRGS
jgi:hypothetical protein